MAVISAFYAKILVVMGLAFPMTEVISNHVPSFSYLVNHLSSHLTKLDWNENSTLNIIWLYFQGFYLYLYFVSILYFLFVFYSMLRNRTAKRKSFASKIRTEFSIFNQFLFNCILQVFVRREMLMLFSIRLLFKRITTKILVAHGLFYFRDQTALGFCQRAMNLLNRCLPNLTECDLFW